MRDFGIYLLMQMKRVVKVFPVILLTALLLCGCMGILAFGALRRNQAKESNTRLQVGLVGDLDAYMGMDIKALLKLLSVRFGIAFQDMTETEARRMLHTGGLSTYVLLPEGFMESLYSGANDVKIVYVSAEGQKGISSIIMDEVAGSISGLITTSQSAIYAMQDLLADKGKTSEIHDATVWMNTVYIGILADMFRICDLTVTGMDHHVSAVGYYMCSIFILFILFMGMNSSTLFTKRNKELSKLMAARGQSAVSQVLGEYLAFFFLMLLCMAAAFLVSCMLLQRELLVIPEWGRFEAGVFLRFFAQMIPVAALLCAMQYLIYEAVDGVVSSILLQFLAALALGYLSGCFYPLSFMPDGMQKIGRATPVGIALSYAHGCLLKRMEVAGFLLMSGYLALFLVLAVALRKRRMAL